MLKHESGFCLRRASHDDVSILSGAVLGHLSAGSVLAEEFFARTAEPHSGL